MNALLWVLQGLLALAFFAHGILFLFPTAEIAQQMAAVIPRWFQLFLGVAEVLAAIGLTVPGITRIRPSLISWAAGGLMIVMVGATVLHAGRGETSSAITTAILFVLLAFVAYQRTKVRPIAPRADRQWVPQ
jgi:DoxX-like protein